MSEIQYNLRPSIQKLLKWVAEADARLRSVEGVIHELQRDHPNLTVQRQGPYLREEDLAKASQTTEVLEAFLRDRVGL